MKTRDIILVIAVLMAFSFSVGWELRDHDETGVWYFHNPAPTYKAEAVRFTIYKDDVVYMSQDDRKFTITMRGMMLYHKINSNFLSPESGDIAVNHVENGSITLNFGAGK